MGAKTAVKLRNRGSAYKCDLCGRKLMTPDALVVHQRTAHNIITRRTKAKPVTKSVKSPKIEIKEKPIKKPLTLLKNTPKISEKKVKEVVKDDSSKTDEESEKKKKTVEFECPKCFRVFMTYFPAHKHIQKFHCVNRQGAKVPPNSPNLIQPVRIELCLKCKRKVKSIQTHVCENIKEKSAQGQVFLCTACEEWFPNLKSFDIHVLSLHGNEVESMFFPTSLEFAKWRIDMEEQTKVKYAIIDNYDSKKYYHCNYVKEDAAKNNITYFCPSTIVIQEFSKGIQVHFYKQHYKHVCQEYALSEKYKKYSITSFLKKSDEYNLLPSSTSDDNDMYLQFKTLMEGIVIDAAKINISTLKILIGKALDMTCILTNYDEEGEENSTSEIRNSSQTMNDSEITKALEENNLTSKRKNIDKIDSPVDIKRTKVDSVRETSPITSSPKILNSFSLANNVDFKNKLSNGENKTNDESFSKADVKLIKESCTSLDSSSSTELVPSSFNDSYKDFVVKNFPVKEKRKKRPVKTKIGQFKPTSPKSIFDSVPTIKSPVSKSPVNSVKQVKPVLQTPVKIAAKKEVKKVNRVSLDKPKVDFEYEVKEQEEGCNILILKI